MKIAIRTDASSRIGSGHIMRCKTLASELHRRGADVRFICRNHPGNLNALLRDDGFTVEALPAAEPPRDAGGYAAWLGATQNEDAAQTRDALYGFAADWLVVDHYGLGESWEKSLRPCAERIFVIDDLANRPHDCDLLLDQNWFGNGTATRYDNLLPRNCLRLLGPRHALLQPQYRQLRANLRERSGLIQRILVFFGAVDSHGQTVNALRALGAPPYADIAVDVVIGSSNRNAAEIAQLAALRPRTTVHSNQPSLAALMEGADLMLGAGGATTWERCCLGLPCIVVAAAENQQGLTQALAECGAQFLLGPAAAVTESDWTNALSFATHSPDKLRAAAANAAAFTDGIGASRVAASMEKSTELKMLRRATRQDESLLLDWANDPEVRRQSFSPATITAAAHHQWFCRKLNDAGCMLLIGEDCFGLPLGQVRFDISGGNALIDISIEPTLRGRGIGRQLLRRALDLLKQEGGAATAIGEVLPGNQASRALFVDTGFASAPAGRNGSQRFAMSLQVEDSPA